MGAARAGTAGPQDVQRVRHRDRVGGEEEGPAGGVGESEKT